MIRGNESQGFARSGRVQEAPIQGVQSWLAGLEASPETFSLMSYKPRRRYPCPRGHGEYLLTTDEAHLYGQS